MEECAVLKKIAENLNALPESQRLLGEYILSNYREAASLSALDLGKKANVSDATVVRFAKSLGYSGYLEIKRELLKCLTMVEESPSAKMIKSLSLVKQVSSAIAEVFQNDIKNIEKTFQDFSAEALDEAVKIIFSSQKVYILGLNSCASLARFLHFHLHRLQMSVQLVISGGLVMFEQLAHISGGDALVVISFPRYSRDTLNAIELARSKGASVVSITDKPYSPVAEASHVFLLAHSSTPAFYNSYAAALTVCNVLVLSVALLDENKALKALKTVEKVKKDLYL